MRLYEINQEIEKLLCQLEPDPETGEVKDMTDIAADLEELSGELIAGGYTAETPAAIVYKATWKEEEKYICTVGTLAQTAKEHNITKTALMIIGEAVTHSNYARSELYNPNFSTEYRKAKSEINPNEVKEK